MGTVYQLGLQKLDTLYSRFVHRVVKVYICGLRSLDSKAAFFSNEQYFVGIGM